MDIDKVSIQVLDGENIPAEETMYLLSVKCMDAPAGEFVQEWLSAMADQIRAGLADIEEDGEILFTSSDGIHEYH